MSVSIASRTPAPVLLAWPGLAALAVAMCIGRFAFTPIWPLMAQEAGLGLAQGGWLASANYAGYLAGALAAVVFPVRRVRAGLLGSLAAVVLLTLGMAVLDGMAAWVAVRAGAGGPRALAAVVFPVRRVRAGLLGSLAAVVLLTLGMAVLDGMAAWLALRLAAGYASAWAFICVAAWRPVPPGAPAEAAILSWTYAGVGVGIAASGLACLALMQAGAGADLNWLALGALAGATALAAALALRRRPAPAAARAAARRPAAPAGERRDIRWLTLHYGLFGMGYIVPATFLPAMAQARVADPA